MCISPESLKSIILSSFPHETVLPPLFPQVVTGYKIFLSDSKI